MSALFLAFLLSIHGPLVTSQAVGGSSGPCVCSSVYNPVCCGGRTFSNACNARCNGVHNADSDCNPRACTTTSSSPIDTSASTAASKPCICTMQYDPVCCGDRTFSNACNARCAGLTDSECRPGSCTSTTTIANSATSSSAPPKSTFNPSNSATKISSGSSTSASTISTFDASNSAPPQPSIPCFCPANYEPVCCDGKTFSNVCKSRCTGLTYTECRAGSCTSTTTITNFAASSSAPPKSTFNPSNSATEISSGSSTSAQPKPSMPCYCTMQYDPVCCGSQTFSNACNARCHGLTSSDCNPGACIRSTTVSSSSTTDNTASTAASHPCICTMQYAPVCCNDRTFSNSCMARCKGINSGCTSGACRSSTSSTIANSDTTAPQTPTYDQFHRRPIPIDNTDASSAAPCICTMQYDPVCCDATSTFSNSCMARCKGVDASRCTTGACGPVNVNVNRGSGIGTYSNRGSSVSSTDSGASTAASEASTAASEASTSNTDGSDTTSTAAVTALRAAANGNESKESGLDAVPSSVWISIVALLLILFIVFFIGWFTKKKQLDAVKNVNSSYTQFQNEETV